MSDIYKTPAAELSAAPDGDMDNFERFTAWGVFGLSVITFGIYMMYWFYTRTRVLNAFHDNKIADGLVYGSLITYVVYFGSSLLPESVYQEPVMLYGSVAVSVLYLVFYLVWLFTFRARLLEIARSHGVNTFRINPALTFFFQSIYLQYKINQYIDNKAD